MNANKGMEVSVSGVTKTFAGVKALDNVSINLLPGKVHGLIGANGAGKSTLIKILAGAYQPDSGDIFIGGEKTVIANPHDAAALGLSFIHQDLNLVQDFSVRENITLGLKKDTRLGFIDWRATEKNLTDIIRRIGFKQSLKTQIKSLSVAEQWLVAIGRALYQNARFIAMDEPTASLTETEVQMLFSVIRDLTAQGIGVIYVSHRLDEIIEICDEVTVFKDGRNVMHAETQSLTKAEIIGAIAGHKVEAIDAVDRQLDDRPVILELNGVGDGGKVKDISLTLRKGEVLGVTGLVGAGRTELAMMIFGANRRVVGEMKYRSAAYNPRTPADAVRSGIVIVPEERRTEGLFTTKSVLFNLNIATLEQARAIQGVPMIGRKKAAQISREIISTLRIKANGVNAQALSLSGGNQQKLVIGKWLSRNPAIIIMDEPTRGVDVGARAEIYKEIRRMAGMGVSFIIISSDVEELPGLCDRVLVMAEGRLTGELSGRMVSKDALLRLCYAQNV
jgi:ribose transport system ATP-binding protein